MYRCICSNECTHRRQQTHHERQPIRAPAAEVTELGEDVLWRSTRRQNPEWDENGEESHDVEDEHADFDRGQLLGQEVVEDEAEGDGGEDHGGCVPALRDVAGVEDDHETLDHGCCERGERGETDLPSYD